MIIIGHRGAMGEQPENTLASFRQAITRGVDMIELDVRRLKTGELAVMHDATVDRTTNGKGKVAHYSLEQIQQLHAGNGEKVPLLHEVFDLVDKQVMINIELKGKDTADEVAKVIKQYQDRYHWADDLFFVSSKYPSELRRFQVLLPAISIGVIASLRTLFTVRYNAKRLQANVVVLNQRSIRRRQVRRAHRRHLKVYAFTVNTKAQMKKMNALGVDGIFTDTPSVGLRPKELR